MPAFFRQYVAVARGENNRQSWPAPPDLPAKLHSAHARHDHIAEHRIEVTVLLQGPQRLSGIGSPPGFVAQVLKELVRERTNILVVLNQQHVAAATIIRS